MQLFKTPVLFIIFNRPHETKRVFQEIKKIKPANLYIAADGPRAGNAHDALQCRKTREIVEEIDWDCNLETLFRENNLGCRKAVSGAIDWFFSEVEQGIIIEDDCVLEQSFFPYCKELLHKYANEEKVMTIGAENVQPGRRTPNSYYFSRFMHCWGWATWKRAWKHYDVDMKSWPDSRKNGEMLNQIFANQKALKYWKKNLDNIYHKKVDTWDWQWTYAIWKNNGINIVPEVNLVSNIGFGKNATHTKNEHSKKAQLNTQPMEFPLKHPKEININEEADNYSQFTHFQEPFFKKVYHKMKGLLRIK